MISSSCMYTQMISRSISKVSINELFILSNYLSLQFNVFYGRLSLFGCVFAKLEVGNKFVDIFFEITDYSFDRNMDQVKMFCKSISLQNKQNVSFKEIQNAKVIYSLGNLNILDDITCLKEFL